MSQVRDRIHQLVDEVPEDDLGALEFWLAERWRVKSRLLRTLAEAPEDDEPVTEEEEAAIEEAKADVAAGRVVPHAEAMRRFLGQP